MENEKNRFHVHSDLVMKIIENKSEKDLETLLNSTLTQVPINIIFERKEERRREVIPKKKANDEIYII